jgi:hypothetical protein
MDTRALRLRTAGRPWTWVTPDGGTIQVVDRILLIERRRYGKTAVDLETLDPRDREITKEWIRTVSTP